MRIGGKDFYARTRADNAQVRGHGSAGRDLPEQNAERLAAITARRMSRRRAPGSLRTLTRAAAASRNDARSGTWLTKPPPRKFRIAPR